VERGVLLRYEGANSPFEPTLAPLEDMFDASALLDPPDWQNQTPRENTPMARQKPLSLPATPDSVDVGLGRTVKRDSPLPPLGNKNHRLPDIDDIFATPLKQLEHRSGRVPGCSPVRPAAALLSGMPKMGHSKVSMFCGFYRSWETQASKCENGPTQFDRDLIFEHANRCIKRISPNAPFQQAPPYVAPWEDPMENVDMSIKALTLIETMNHEEEEADEEEEVDDGTFKVKPLSEMQETLPGWVYPKNPPPVLGAYAHGAAIDARGF